MPRSVLTPFDTRAIAAFVPRLALLKATAFVLTRPRLPVLESVLAEWGHKPAARMREASDFGPAALREEPALPAA